MGFAKTIYLKSRSGNPKPYYYWEEFDSWEEAHLVAKKIKKERKEMGTNIKYTIVTANDSWFLPVTKYIVYLNRKLRII